MISSIWDLLITQTLFWILVAVAVILGLSFLYQVLCAIIPGPKQQKGLKLKDKTVLITGASYGIGRAMAFEFYKKGAKLILASRNTTKLQELCEELVAIGEESGWKNGNKPVFEQLDIEQFKDKTESEIFEQLASIRALARDGKTIDVLVNNAGLMSYGSAKDTPAAVLRRVMEVNFFGHIALTKAVIDYIPDDGAIVTMSSILGRGVAMPYQAPYSASKHAIQAYFDAIRGEERPNLQILTVVAGYINSGFGSRALDVAGQPTGQEDPNQLKGYSAEYSAKQIVQAVMDRETELLLAPFVPRLLLSLRLFTPNLLWLILSKHSEQKQN